LRPQVNVVLQDTILFSGTVRENIACSAPEATPEQLEGAARVANADEFIRALPDGYDTVIGERGATLSQGQRQRIALARAALHRAPILLLDEPTTGLDEENERQVSMALQQVWRGSTTILATHDLKLVDQADLVLYLEKGRLVECGSPQELMAAKLRFFELYNMQRPWRARETGTDQG
jgi:ATP-binding cassette subfamily B protein